MSELNLIFYYVLRRLEIGFSLQICCLAGPGSHMSVLCEAGDDSPGPRCGAPTGQSELVSVLQQPGTWHVVTHTGGK